MATNGYDCIGGLIGCVDEISAIQTSSLFLIDVYDVKFYPFGKPTEDPIFAAVGGNQVSL